MASASSRGSEDSTSPVTSPSPATALSRMSKRAGSVGGSSEPTSVTDGSTPDPSTMMFGPSPPPATKGGSTSSTGDSPVSLTPRPESAPDTTMNAGSGKTSSGSLARWDPDTSSWRTSQASLAGEGSLPFSGRWPRSGTMRNGSLYEHPMSVRPTEESAYSSSPKKRWSPPSNQQDEDLKTFGKDKLTLINQSFEREKRGRATKEDLKLMNEYWEKSPTGPTAECWPTPTSQGGKGYMSGSNRDHWHPTLHSAAKMWATLRANEKGQYNSKDSHVALSRQVRKYANEDSTLWPTLDAQASVTYKVRSDGRQGLGLEGRVRLWATPRAIYGEHPGITDTSHLTGQSISVTGGAKGLWATVKKQSANTPAEHGHGGKDIQTQVALWATLKSRDWKGLSQRGIHQPGDALPNQVSLFGLPGRSNSTDGPNSSPSVRTSPQPWPQLNPRFAEWIMGFPIGWTDLGGSGTPSSRPRRRPRSGISGGG